MKKHLLPVCLLSALLLASCSTVLNNLPGIYSLEIQQGNIVDQAMIDQLRPGMGKRQVLFIMGSPMLVDTFHQKRWDYIYSDQISGKDKQQKRITLVFDGDQLVGLQGDLKPGNLPTTRNNNDLTIDVPKRNLDKTLWEKLTGWFGYSERAADEPPTAKPQKADDDSPY